MHHTEAVLAATPDFQPAPPTHPLVDLLRRGCAIVRNIVHPRWRSVLKSATRPPHPPPLQSVTHDPSSPDDLLCQFHLSLAQKLRPFLSSICDWLAEDDVQIVGGQPISAGGSADIWRGSLDTRQVAIKSYRRYLSFDLFRVYLRFSREALVCSRLSHRNIVSFIGIYCTTKHPFSLVFNFASHLDLRVYLKTHPTAGRLELLVGIARGLNHMHDLDIVHGSLKTANILVDLDGTARIAGLGSAFIVGHSEMSAEWSCRGSAPESMPEGFGLFYPHNTKASDVYAFGVLAWEVFMGHPVFFDDLDIIAAYRMWKGHRPPRPDHHQVSDQVWEMMKQCWERLPSKRTNIREVVRTLEVEHAAGSRGSI